jgi:tRNA pseudouridine65 synthase
LLEIVYQDEDFIAINKPHGLLVHRSPIAADASEFAIQLLRDQIGQKVYPCHRIDRKTGGVLLFSLHEKGNILMQKQFMNNEVKKTYHAIVRGFAPEEMRIDYALTNDKGKTQDAITDLIRLNTCELEVAHGKHSTSRYSLLELHPQTGRFHQLRKHLAHIFHPIIGDRPHGCNKQNKLFLETWEMNTMLLHSTSITLVHPIQNKEITIQSTFHSEMERMIQLMNFTA